MTAEVRIQEGKAQRSQTESSETAQKWKKDEGQQPGWNMYV